MSDAGAPSVLISAAESAASKWLLARCMTGLGIAVGSAWYGPVSVIIGIAVGVVVKYGDVLGFMLINGWHNTLEGIAFEKAADELQNLPKDATDEERQQAELAQMAAFAALQGLGDNPDGGTHPPP